MYCTLHGITPEKKRMSLGLNYLMEIRDLVSKKKHVKMATDYRVVVLQPFDWLVPSPHIPVVRVVLSLSQAVSYTHLGSS